MLKQLKKFEKTIWKRKSDDANDFKGIYRPI